MEKQGRKIVVEFKNDNPNGIRIVKNPSFPFDAYIIPRCCMAETTNAIPEKKIGIYLANISSKKMFHLKNCLLQPNLSLVAAAMAKQNGNLTARP